MKIIISVANMHQDLTAMSLSLLDALRSPEVEILMDCNDQSYERYGFDVNWDRMHYDADFVVGIDEDAFLVRPESIRDMIDCMQENKIGFVGVPEKGVSRHRNFSERYMNPFFSIFNINVLKNIEMDKETLRWYEKDIPRREACFGLYAWLKDQGVPFVGLQGRDHDDLITTVLKDFGGNEFLYHTWFAREWDTDPRQKARINSVFWTVQRIRGLG